MSDTDQTNGQAETVEGWDVKYAWSIQSKSYERSLESRSKFVAIDSLGGCRLTHKLSSNELLSVLQFLPIRQLMMVFSTCKQIHAELTPPTKLLVWRRFKSTEQYIPTEISPSYPLIESSLEVSEGIMQYINYDIKSIRFGPHSGLKWLSSSLLRHILPVTISVRTTARETIDFVSCFGSPINLLERMGDRPTQRLVRWSETEALEIIPLLNLSYLKVWDWIGMPEFSGRLGGEWLLTSVLTELFRSAPRLEIVNMNLQDVPVRPDCRPPPNEHGDDSDYDDSDYESEDEDTRNPLDYLGRSAFQQASSTITSLRLSNCSHLHSDQLAGFASLSGLRDLTLRPILYCSWSASKEERNRPTTFHHTFGLLAQSMGLGHLETLDFGNINTDPIDPADLYSFFSYLTNLVTLKTWLASFNSLFSTLALCGRDGHLKQLRHVYWGRSGESRNGYGTDEPSLMMQVVHSLPHVLWHLHISGDSPDYRSDARRLYSQIPSIKLNVDEYSIEDGFNCN